PLATHIGTELLPLGDGDLSRLVLRPAVEVSNAVLVRHPLLLCRDRVACVATAVVAADLLGEAAVVVAIGMDGHRWRQAHADEPFPRGPAEAQAGHGEDPVR